MDQASCCIPCTVSLVCTHTFFILNKLDTLNLDLASYDLGYTQSSCVLICSAGLDLTTQQFVHKSSSICPAVTNILGMVVWDAKLRDFCSWSWSTASVSLFQRLVAGKKHLDATVNKSFKHSYRLWYIGLGCGAWALAIVFVAIWCVEIVEDWVASDTLLPKLASLTAKLCKCNRYMHVCMKLAYASHQAIASQRPLSCLDGSWSHFSAV